MLIIITTDTQLTVRLMNTQAHKLGCLNHDTEKQATVVQTVGFNYYHQLTAEYIYLFTYQRPVKSRPEQPKAKQGQIYPPKKVLPTVICHHVIYLV